VQRGCDAFNEKNPFVTANVDRYKMTYLLCTAHKEKRGVALFHIRRRVKAFT